MIDVSRTTPLPATTLWPLLSDVRRWGDWLPTVDSVTPVEPDRPDEVGASYVVVQPGLPRATWTITAWTPGRSFTWESRARGVRSTGTHDLVEGPDGTTIRLGIRWEGPLAGLVRWLVGRKAADYVTREAAALESTAAARTTGA
ncbi:SRPBCC family protein [Phycicoccus sonneratiae]|uniref:SRPBCC family protein n=1 Tax=Phycicoccus sonneratiae TaxID=2807628 RepID=A0ABS2CRK0_9MICO|nr:SRPBCC family protein [Phycicoccus sonneraticus]MBM6402509.1 SRPBCC family protein [Phycicoccus sonneraticus]